jgi:hypothetical protein
MASQYTDDYLSENQRRGGVGAGNYTWHLPVQRAAWSSAKI